MFEKGPPEAAFFEFFSPVYFAGIGYAQGVAIKPEFASNPLRPALSEYIATADGYLFVTENGSCTCVSSANVKFLAGEALAVVERPTDGNKDREVGDKAVEQGEEHANEDAPRSAPTPSNNPTPEAPGGRQPLRGRTPRHGAGNRAR